MSKVSGSIPTSGSSPSQFRSNHSSIKYERQDRSYPPWPVTGGSLPLLLPLTFCSKPYPPP